MKNITKILLALAALFILGGIMVSCSQEVTVDSTMVKTAEKTSPTTTDTSSSDAGKVVVYYVTDAKVLTGSSVEYEVEDKKVEDADVTSITGLMDGKAVTGMSFENITEITGVFSGSVFTGTLKDLQFDGALTSIGENCFRTSVNLENVDFTGEAMPKVASTAFPAKDEYTTNCGFGVPVSLVEEARETLKDFIDDNGYLKVEVKILLNTNEEYYKEKDDEFGTPELSKTEVSTYVGRPVSVSTPTNEGYIFLGFYADEDTTATQVFDADGNANTSATDYINEKGAWINTAEETTLYAHWSKEPEAGFTVNAAGKRVDFAKGNLYYTSATKGFEFEENQYEYRTYAGKAALINGVFSDTGTPSENIGLFYWASSTNLATAFEYDWDKASENDTFFANGLEIGGETWQVLSEAEWNYIFDGRPGAADKWGLATLNISEGNGAHGLVLLSDSFVLPEGCSFTSGKEQGWNTNSYTKEDWEKMESSGAVFLPVSGWRVNDNWYNDMGGEGYYWTSTQYALNGAKSLYFRSENVTVKTRECGQAFSIRLVSVLKPGPEVKITFDANGGEGTMDAVSTHYGDETKLPAGTFIKEGYAFAGWTTASDSDKVIYKNEGIVSFTEDTMLYAVWKNPLAFSVSDNKTVIFASGNLYYDSEQNLYSFEENQYDYRTRGGLDAVVDGEGNITNDKYTGLFFWDKDEEIARSASYTRSSAELSTEDRLFANSTFNGWIVLSEEEWKYLTLWRTDANSKIASATISAPHATVKGLVFLSDYFTLPQGCSFTSGFSGNWETNKYTADEWEKMENAGALFLPAIGYCAENNTTGAMELYNTPNGSSPYLCVDTSTLTSGCALEIDMEGSGCNTVHNLSRWIGGAIRLAKVLSEAQ